MISGPCLRPAPAGRPEGNGRAQRFYRKLGYRLDGATKPHAPTGAIEVRTVRR
jgi:hypothetical protein